MGFYMDSAAPKTLYRSAFMNPYFVDKSMALKELFQMIDAGNEHIALPDRDVLERRS